MSLFSFRVTCAVWSSNSCRGTHGSKVEEEGPDWMQPTPENVYTVSTAKLVEEDSIGRAGVTKGGTWQTKYPTARCNQICQISPISISPEPRGRHYWLRVSFSIAQSGPPKSSSPKWLRQTLIDSQTSTSPGERKRKRSRGWRPPMLGCKRVSTICAIHFSCFSW